MPPPKSSRLGTIGSRAEQQQVASAITTDAHMPCAPQFEEPSQWNFVPARKRIQSDRDLKAFLESETVRDFVGFILYLNEAVKGKKVSDACSLSKPVIQILEVLDTLEQWVDSIPPVEHKLRYGNPAFRTWFRRVEKNAKRLMATVLPERLGDATQELAPYFVDSFGNPTRIDYGTGHETTFCAFLFCVAKLGLVGQEDCQGLVLRVFKKYLDLMRKVQTTYWLEPAGSHGVWGLDDYQFLPFIWGSGQLMGHPVLKPKSIHNGEVLQEMEDEYMYLGCVRFVKDVKKGPLWETSPILCDIAAVHHWAKVNSGLVKMYKAEVLGKFPIMQHFLFGSLIQFPEKA